MELENLSKERMKPVEGLEALWENQALSLSREQVESIGVAYLRHYLGMTDSQIAGLNVPNFAPIDTDAYNEAVVLCVDPSRAKRDYEAFWHAVDQLTEGQYSSEQVASLIESQDPQAVHSMMFAVGHYARGIMQMIQTIWHVAK